MQRTTFSQAPQRGEQAINIMGGQTNTGFGRGFTGFGGVAAGGSTNTGNRLTTPQQFGGATEDLGTGIGVIPGFDEVKLRGELQTSQQENQELRMKLQKIEEELGRFKATANHEYQYAENSSQNTLYWQGQAQTYLNEKNTLAEKLTQAEAVLQDRMKTIDWLSVDSAGWQLRVDRAQEVSKAQEDAYLKEEAEHNQTKEELDRFKSLVAGNARELQASRSNIEDAQRARDLALDESRRQVTEIGELRDANSKLQRELDNIRVVLRSTEERHEQAHSSSENYKAQVESMQKQIDFAFTASGMTNSGASSPVLLGRISQQHPQRLSQEEASIGSAPSGGDPTAIEDLLQQHGDAHPEIRAQATQVQKIVQKSKQQASEISELEDQLTQLRNQFEESEKSLVRAKELSKSAEDAIDGVKQQYETDFNTRKQHLEAEYQTKMQQLQADHAEIEETSRTRIQQAQEVESKANAKIQTETERILNEERRMINLKAVAADVSSVQAGRSLHEKDSELSSMKIYIAELEAELQTQKELLAQKPPAADSVVIGESTNGLLPTATNLDLPGDDEGAQSVEEAVQSPLPVLALGSADVGFQTASQVEKAQGTATTPIRQGSAVTGAGGSLQGTPKASAKKLDTLERKIQSLVEQNETLADDLKASEKKLTATTSELEEVQGELEDVSNEKRLVDAELASKRTEITELEVRLKSAPNAAEIEKQSQDLTEIRVEKDELEALYKAICEEVEGLRASKVRQTNTLFEKSHEIETLKAFVSELQSQVDVAKQQPLQQEQSSNSVALSPSTKQRSDSRDVVEERLSGQPGLEDDIDEDSEGPASFTQTSQINPSQIADLREELNKANERRGLETAKLEKEITKLNKKVFDLEAELAENKKEKQTDAKEIKKLQSTVSELEREKEYLEEQRNLAEDEALRRDEESSTLKPLKDQISKLKGEVLEKEKELNQMKKQKEVIESEYEQLRQQVEDTHLDQENMNQGEDSHQEEIAALQEVIEEIEAAEAPSENAAGGDEVKNASFASSGGVRGADYDGLKKKFDALVKKYQRHLKTAAADRAIHKRVVIRASHIEELHQLTLATQRAANTSRMDAARHEVFDARHEYEIVKRAHEHDVEKIKKLQKENSALLRHQVRKSSTTSTGGASPRSTARSSQRSKREREDEDKLQDEEGDNTLFSPAQNRASVKAEQERDSNSSDTEASSVSQESDEESVRASRKSTRKSTASTRKSSASGRNSKKAPSSPKRVAKKKAPAPKKTSVKKKGGK